jgi:D-aspartate ligase
MLRCKVVTGALLFLGDYYGTLASARCLGRRNIDVALVDVSRFSRAGVSRHVRTSVRSPETNGGSVFVRWLLSQRKVLGGRVLYPASDELVYLFAEHREELLESYKLYMPPFANIRAILNKQLLYQACGRAGVRHPKTWFPRNETELRAIESEIDVDVLLKPKTQVQFRSGQKGAEVPRGGDLGRAFRAFVQANPYGSEIVSHDPEVAAPMVQAFYKEAVSGIYSLAGFSDGTGRPPLVRASRKVLQRPRRVGIGLCFEGADVRPEVVRHVGALCQELGYFGIFEIEFIEHEGEFLLIDFNPRGYSQMAFEDARSLPLPYLHYLGAVGDSARLAEEWDKAASWQPTGEHAYCNDALLGLVRAGQAVSRVLGRESEHWGRWTRRYSSRLTRAVAAEDDALPRFMDAVKHADELFRHPRSFSRSLMR